MYLYVDLTWDALYAIIKYTYTERTFNAFSQWAKSGRNSAMNNVKFEM